MTPLAARDGTQFLNTRLRAAARTGVAKISTDWKRVLLDFVTQFVVESLVIVVGAVLLIWFLAWAD